MNGGRRQADVVVVGSGPGGATVGLELARAGMRVAILERGRDHRGTPAFGTYLGPLLYTDRRALFFSREGMQIVRPLMVGGATSMYCGSAAMPPSWLRERYEMDVERHANQAAMELGVAPLPIELRGAASNRLAEAGRSLGQDWQPQPKFMSVERAPRFECAAHCMLGCRCGAKWSAAEWVDEAVAAGAAVFTGARVRQVMVDGASARGVRAAWRGQTLDIEAPIVVLAAGGLGTPEILRRSGVGEVGRGLAMDTTVIVYGVSPAPGNGYDPPMTWAYRDGQGRFMLSALVDPWLLFPLINSLVGLRRALEWRQWSQMLGVMVKLKDELAGEVRPDGSVSKPLSDGDRERLDKGIEQARQVLVAAGADEASVFVSPPRGTHPSATVRLGEAVDRDLQTRVSGLYVCDASVLPESLGQPTVLTIIALAKRLADHLLGRSGIRVPSSERSSTML